MANYRSEKLKRAIASLPCVACGIEGASQHAHANTPPFGKAMAIKADDYAAFPLCHEGANGCHVQHDQNKAGLSAVQRIDLEYEYIFKTFAMLIERGLLEVK